MTDHDPAPSPAPGAADDPLLTPATLLDVLRRAVAGLPRDVRPLPTSDEV